MNRTVTIFQSQAVNIRRFDHAEGCAHHDSESELTQSVAVAFVERGSFDVLQSKHWWPFRESDVLVSTPGVVRRYRHDQEFPSDVCLSLSFASDVTELALGKLPSKLLAPLVPSSSGTRFARAWMNSALRSGDSLFIENAAFHCACAFGPHSWNRSVHQSGSFGHARRIRSAIESLLSSIAESRSLSSMAREVGMSPFHFARTFSELTGQSPHQYLLKLRLRHAATMLRDGASVTQSALDSGFENLSHFSRTFRRRFGVSPSSYRSVRPSSQNDPTLRAGNGLNTKTQ
jgi:AraC-like DNA-binding protein